MRLRLGLLQDPAAIDRQIAREVAEAEAKRAKTVPAIPTVKTEEQMKADMAKSAKEKDQVSKKVKAEHKPPRIRPLSESKAIDSGANFISESFLFLVAGALIIYENRRGKKKQEAAHDARDDEIEEIRKENSTIKAEVEQLRHDLLLVQNGQLDSVPTPIEKAPQSGTSESPAQHLQNKTTETPEKSPEKSLMVNAQRIVASWTSSS